MKYIPVIGLEIHCELLTNSKVFCSCENSFGKSANSRVCPVCMGLPGTLPRLNGGAITLAAKAGIALGCKINNYSAFDRKNYFYPDLPKAYQITQFDSPICSDGAVSVTGGKIIRVNRIHIEEDAGKLLHDDNEGISLADYNRCGVPLIEIVTEPDFRAVKEVLDFVEQVVLRLKYADVCDARMEQGSLRVDVNISVMPEGSDKLGTRAEIKNLNSLKAIAKAIEYEIQRQSEILLGGGRVIQETRRYNDRLGITEPLRSKEEAHDYRYFPEPDIPPVFLTDEEIDLIKAQMPFMPQERFIRYTEEYKLPEDDARLIISDRAFSDFYDEAVTILPEYKQISNLMLVELNRNLNETGFGMESIKFSPADLAQTVKMACDGVISKNAAKEIVAIMFESGEKPMSIAESRGFIMNNDVGELEAVLEKVLEDNAEHVISYKNGNEKLFGFLTGQFMRALGGSANPQLARKLLEEKLKS